MRHSAIGEAEAAQARIVGCFRGLAIGDAIGKQTETLTREEVHRWYPDGIRGFEGRPGDVIPRYIGNPKREWRIAETTDDTERTIAVAQAILSDGHVDHTTVGRELLKCKKCIHPGIRSLWEFHAAGDPSRIATQHDGCGAAVRVAPVGVIYRPDRLDRIVEGAYQASIPTHGGQLAICAASAVAAAVSAAVDGNPPAEVARLAIEAARAAERLVPASHTPTMASAIQEVHDKLAEVQDASPREIWRVCFPSTPLTIVPLALALATMLRSARDLILLASNVGGDADSVASIGGAISGALFPDSVSDDWSRVVEEINHHDLARIGMSLAKLRP